MKEENVWEYLKRTVRASGMAGQLVAVNIIVFLFIGAFYLVGSLFNFATLGPFVHSLFAAPIDPSFLLKQPWSIVTQLFAHGDILHLLFNMVMLYFSGRMFVHFFGSKRLLTTYLLGGVFAYLFHILAFYSLPKFTGAPAGTILGASGAIYAIFTALVIHRPNLKVRLFLIPVEIPIFVVFIVFILMNLGGIIDQDPAKGTDNVAYFAHIGGAIFGWLSVLNSNSQKNIMNRFERWLSKLKWPSFKRKPKMKVHGGGGAARNMTDEEYNAASKAHQDRIDAILEKISKKGYEGLTKEEKDILFHESKRKQ